LNFEFLWVTSFWVGGCLYVLEKKKNTNCFVTIERRFRVQQHSHHKYMVTNYVQTSD